MKRLWPVGFLVAFFVLLFKDFFFKGLIPVPADTLVGAYYPWLDYKWGYAVGVPVKNALISDVFSYFFIIKHLAADILKQGIIPYWNSYSFAGTPLLATFHSTVLSPWNLFFLLPKHIGWGMHIFASFLFAALSMYFYLTVIVKNRLSRIIGSLIFSLAGPMTTWAEFGTAVWAAGAIPLILLSLEMILIYHQTRYILLMVSSLVLLIFSGHVQLLTYALLLIPIYAFSRNRNIKKLFLVAIGVFAGIALTAIQLIPTAEFYTRSIRADDKYAQTFNFGLVDAPQLVRLWIPDFFGHPVTGNSWGQYIYHEYASFVGTLIFPLILAALFYQKKFPVTFYSWMFIFSLFLVLNQPVSRWFFSLPLPLITYSSASRLFFLTGISASVLTATFLDDPKWKRLILPLSLLILLTVMANYFSPTTFQKISIRNSVFPLFQLVFFLGIIFTKKLNRFLLVLLLVILSFDLSRYFIKYNPFVPENLIFPTTPVIDFLKAKSEDYRIVREPAALMPPNTWAMYGFENIEGYDPLYSKSYNRFFHVINFQPYYNSAGRYSELTDFNPLFINATNVKYLLALKPKDLKNVTPYLDRILKNNYPNIFSDGHTWVYENPDVLPRAYFASNIIQVNSELDLANSLNSPGFNPGTTAVLMSAAGVKTGSGYISEYSSGPNKFSFVTNVDSSGLLVIANAYDPGWVALVDGKSANVYPVNGGLLGLQVPEGIRQVEFSYSPPLMNIALILSSVSWLAVITSCFVFTRKIV